MAATAERRKGRHRPDIGSRAHVPAQTAHGRRTEPRIPDCRGGLRRSTTRRLQYHADRAAARRSGPSAPDARARKERLHRGGETAFPARPDRPGYPAVQLTLAFVTKLVPRRTFALRRKDALPTSGAWIAGPSSSPIAGRTRRRAESR